MKTLKEKIVDLTKAEELLTGCRLADALEAATAALTALYIDCQANELGNDGDASHDALIERLEEAEVIRREIAREKRPLPFLPRKNNVTKEDEAYLIARKLLRVVSHGKMMSAVRELFEDEAAFCVWHPLSCDRLDQLLVWRGVEGSQREATPTEVIALASIV